MADPSNAFFERPPRANALLSDVDPDASSLTGRGPRRAPYVAAREADVAERTSDWFVSQGLPRWQADRIGALAPYTPPGAAFAGGQDIGPGINEGNPWRPWAALRRLGWQL